MSGDKKWRMPWFADTNVKFYENDTEPKLFPDLYTRYIELEAYEQAQARIAELESEAAVLHARDTKQCGRIVELEGIRLGLEQAFQEHVGAWDRGDSTSRETLEGLVEAFEGLGVVLEEE